MGRTYKRNDTYRSNRPKSLREKRQWSGSKKWDDNSFSTGYDNSVENYNKQSPRVTDYDLSDFND